MASHCTINDTNLGLYEKFDENITKNSRFLDRNRLKYWLLMAD